MSDPRGRPVWKTLVILMWRGDILQMTVVMRTAGLYIREYSGGESRVKECTVWRAAADDDGVLPLLYFRNRGSGVPGNSNF